MSNPLDAALAGRAANDADAMSPPSWADAGDTDADMTDNIRDGQQQTDDDNADKLRAVGKDDPPGADSMMGTVIGGVAAGVAAGVGAAGAALSALAKAPESLMQAAEGGVQSLTSAFGSAGSAADPAGDDVGYDDPVGGGSGDGSGSAGGDGGEGGSGGEGGDEGGEGTGGEAGPESSLASGAPLTSVVPSGSPPEKPTIPVGALSEPQPEPTPGAGGSGMMPMPMGGAGGQPAGGDTARPSKKLTNPREPHTESVDGKLPEERVVRAAKPVRDKAKGPVVRVEMPGEVSKDE